MPTKCGKKDSKGTYCQWGSKGAHYYYTPGNKESMAKARKKADKQGAAAHASGYKGALDEIMKENGEIQSIIFKKPLFTRKTAIKWAKSHDFRYNTSRETENTIRLRQFPPEKCRKAGGMKEIDEGIQVYICIKSEEKSDENGTIKDNKVHSVPKSTESDKGLIDYLKEAYEEDKANEDPHLAGMKLGDLRKDYMIPLSTEELEEGHIVKYKGKIAKIIKVIYE